MPVKPAYRIPDGLNKSTWDTVITLSTRKGVAIKPLPIKVIFGFIGGGLLVWWLVQSSVMAPSPIYLKIILAILCGILMTMLLLPDKTGTSRATLVPALFNYVQKSNRNVIVRRDKPVNNFMHISGISQVYPDRGLIRFTDGAYGFAYRVVGNASVLLFNEDKDAVIERADNFYRKMKTDYQLIYLTAKEPQHVREQLDIMHEKYKNLQYADDDLKAIFRMEYRILKKDVGERFRSTHQYLIVRANNPEALQVAKSILLSECDSSTYMFKETEALIGDDLVKMLGSIFKGRESI